MEEKNLKYLYRALFSPGITRFTLRASKDKKVNEYNLEKTSIKGLRAFELPGLLFIEQNPNKRTKWARLAKKGHKIMWVIDTKTNKYLAVVDNEKLTRLNKDSD
jgi:hypothetical protein